MEDFSMKSAYLEDWMDTIESLPGELQRNFTLIRELDSMAQSLLRDVEKSSKEFLEKGKDQSREERKELLKKLSDCFKKSISHGESKVNLAVQTYEMVDKHIRRLDDDLLRFEDELTITGPKIQPNRVQKEEKRDSPAKKRKVINQRTQSNGNGHIPTPPLKKERKQRESSVSLTGRKPPRDRSIPPELNGKNEDSSVDPNEPTYCICNQVSYGAMIACDNEDCDIEWFHYECVGLDSPPKGKWYCDDCQKKLEMK